MVIKVSVHEREPLFESELNNLDEKPSGLRAVLTDIIEDASNELSTTARLVLQRAFEHWRELDEHMRWCDRQVGLHVRSSPAAKRAAKVIGIGELGASALTAGRDASGAQC